MTPSFNISAFKASSLRRAGGIAAGLAALAVLAACGGEAAGPASDFKPVPVNPVIGDVPMGSPDAKVELVEYAALTCHACRDFAKQTLPRLKSAYIDTGKIKYIYRDFPLEADPQTGKATNGFGVTLASVARCKGAEHFHEMLDALFTAQADILEAAGQGRAGVVLSEVIAKQGLTPDEATTCMDHQPALNASIRKSRDDASTNLNVNSTPSIFVDGVRVENPTYDNIVAAIEAKLNPGAPPPAATDAPGTVAPTTVAPATPTTPAPGAPVPATPPQ